MIKRLVDTIDRLSLWIAWRLPGNVTTITTLDGAHSCRNLNKTFRNWIEWRCRQLGNRMTLRQVLRTIDVFMFFAFVSGLALGCGITLWVQDVFF